MLSKFLNTLATFAVLATTTYAGTFQQVTNWGAANLNPTNVRFYIYLPDRLAPNPPIVVALHGCMGNAAGFRQQTGYTQQADRLGFIAIYPEAPTDNNCWSVNKKSTLTHEGGGDTQGVANFVKYVIQRYGADASRVFMVGSSSGGMMVNALAGTYPDVFAAGASYSGVAYGCLDGSPGASPFTADPTCANGEIRKTDAEWTAKVREGFPGYTGKYPRMQIWHGTADNLVRYPNLAQQLAQWSGIHGVTHIGNSTNTPKNGYTTMNYSNGNLVQGISAANVGHVVPDDAGATLRFFGIA